MTGWRLHGKAAPREGGSEGRGFAGGATGAAPGRAERGGRRGRNRMTAPRDASKRGSAQMAASRDAASPAEPLRGTRLRRRPLRRSGARPRGARWAARAQSNDRPADGGSADDAPRAKISESQNAAERQVRLSTTSQRSCEPGGWAALLRTNARSTGGGAERRARSAGKKRAAAIKVRQPLNVLVPRSRVHDGGTARDGDPSAAPFASSGVPAPPATPAWPRAREPALQPAPPAPPSTPTAHTHPRPRAAPTPPSRVPRASR